MSPAGPPTSVSLPVPPVSVSGTGGPVTAICTALKLLLDSLLSATAFKWSAMPPIQ